MRKYISKEEFIFNTKVYQKVFLDDEKNALILDRASDIMFDFEERLSFFKENSDISAINKNAGESFVPVSKDTFEIIKSAKYYSKITGGIFDISVAPLVAEWGINKPTARVLDESEVSELLKLVNYSDISLDEQNQAVMLTKRGAKIDLGGIAKGYIADKIIEFYKENNIKSAIINIGGNIKVLGKKNNDNLWKIGIFEPKKHSEESICAIDGENLSVVTSGGYERTFKYNDRYYHHILNPKTGYPAITDLKSITVISDKSIEADALSTPLFIMGKNMASQFIIANRISAIMVTNNNEIIITKDLLPKFSLFKNYEVLAF